MLLMKKIKPIGHAAYQFLGLIEPLGVLFQGSPAIISIPGVRTLFFPSAESSIYIVNVDKWQESPVNVQ